MRKARGKLSKLPEAIRTQMNQKISDGCQLNTIVRWLFAQKAKRDIVDLGLKTGEPYSLAWTRDAQDYHQAFHNCCSSLSQYYQDHYPLWLAEKAQQSESIRLLEYVDKLDSAAKETGQPSRHAGINRIIRSLLFDAISRARKRKAIQPDELARLANAWARVSGADVSAENAQLRQQDSVDTGLQALYEDVKDNPAALELFNKFRDLVKASTPQRS